MKSLVQAVITSELHQDEHFGESFIEYLLPVKSESGFLVDGVPQLILLMWVSNALQNDQVSFLFHFFFDLSA